MKKNTKNIHEITANFASSAVKYLSFLIIFTVSLLAFDYDAEYLEINQTYQLNKDGSITETYHNKIKLHTYRATQSLFGEDFIIYNPEMQDLIIKKSVTTMADGKLVPTPANGYNEVLPRGAAGDASLTAYREMVVTHTGLERGCVIDFEYSIKSKAGYFPGLMGEVVFAKDNPVKSWTVEVIVPEEMELKFAILNGDLALEKREEKGNRVYSWKRENTDPVLLEPNLVSFTENQTKLVFSSLQDWDQLFDYFSEAIDQQDKFTVEMQQKVIELTKGLSSPFEKKQSLQNFVANHTGYAELHPEFTGFKIKDVVKTYSENSGTSLDKAVLLSSLLNFAGFDAYVSFVSKSGSFAETVPSLYQFGDLMVTTRWTNGETHILSPVHSQNNSLDADLSGKFLFRLDKKLKKIQACKNYNEKANCQAMMINLELSDDLKFSGKGTFNFSGKYNPYYTFRENDKAASVLSGSLGNLMAEKASVTSLNIKSASIDADLSSEILEMKKGFIYLILPEFATGLTNQHIVTALTNRKTTLDLHNSQSEKYTIRIELPENIKVVTPEYKAYKKCDIGTVRTELSVDDNVLTIEKSLILKTDKVAPEEYTGFRDMIKIWDTEMLRQIVLKVLE